MDDLISRKVAIDALKEHRNLFCDNTPDTFSVLPYGDKCRVDELDMAIATLINLPSAQLEWDDLLIICGNCDHTIHVSKMNSQHIIRCKHCKYYHDSDGCFFSTAEVGEDGFCSWAERRTDG